MSTTMTDTQEVLLTAAQTDFEVPPQPATPPAPLTWSITAGAGVTYLVPSADTQSCYVAGKGNATAQANVTVKAAAPNGVNATYLVVVAATSSITSIAGTVAGAITPTRWLGRE